MTGIVAIIGAECTGKSTLAVALARELGGAVVSEHLRSFVQEHGRVPTAAEQPAVMAEQIAAERRAAAGSDWVVSDSGAIMTAVYSRIYYGDDSLIAAAAEHHRSAYLLTLWCDVDLPWVPDPGQRDGPESRAAGHEAIRALLAAEPFPAARVSGTPAQRLRAALGLLGAA